MSAKSFGLPTLALGLVALVAWPSVRTLLPPSDGPAPPTREVAAPVEAVAAAAQGAAPVPAPEAAPPAPAAPALVTTTIEIGKRDTVVGALVRNTVLSRTAHEIAGALRAAGADLRRVKPGDRLELARDDLGESRRLSFEQTPWLRFVAVRDENAWSVERLETTPEVRVEAREGTIDNSLWDAVESGVLAPSVLLDLVQMFESEFDFTADARSGDRFRLLVEARYADGRFVEPGRILAAQYISADRTFTGVGFENGGRYSYYDPLGRALKKMFLRSPLRFTRISSRFTYRRPHPILGGVRPHLAIDYAAPTGTPVWAVADGIVRAAGRNRGNGIQVVLRHRAGYDTYYNHLSRIARGVRRGARVHQKQVIGYVGATGLATGPHLDYRVAHHGRFVNPLGEKFLPGDPVPAAARERFLAQAGALVERLEAEAPLQRGESAPVTW